MAVFTARTINTMSQRTFGTTLRDESNKQDTSFPKLLDGKKHIRKIDARERSRGGKWRRRRSFV